MIVIVLGLLYIINFDQSTGYKKECMNFEQSDLIPYYNDHGIKINKDEKRLIKGKKSAYYIFRFNTIKSKNMISDKRITRNVLLKYNMPQPHFYNWNKKINSGINWIKIRSRLKLPLVVKPSRGTQGNDVYVNIKSYDTAKKIVNKLLLQKHDILIEEMLIGYTYRILILNGEIISIIKRHSPQVIGNGINTLNGLINNLQSTNKYKVDVSWNNGKLSEYSKTQIIPQGVRIELTKTVNLHNGATNEKINIQSVHPDNLAMFKQLNIIFNLKLSGVDYISRDLSIPYTSEHGGGIVEINYNPGIESNFTTDPDSIKKLINNIEFT
jgi:cyanophycin synthetase